MPKTSSHFSQTSPHHSYSGEQVARPLVDWLNLASHTDAAEIVKLIRNIQQLHAIRQQIRRAVATSAGRDELGDLDYAQFSLLNRINSILGLHHYIPRLVEDDYEVSWTFAAEDGGAISEELPFYGVLQALTQNAIDRVAACGCGTWFYKRFAHQRFCTQPCQQKTYRQGHRQKQRAYMRERRRNEREQNVRTMLNARNLTRSAR